MKKVTNYLLLFFMSATVLFLTSCGEDGEDILTPDVATLNIEDGSGAEFPDTTVTQGDTIDIYLAIEFGEAESADLSVTDDLGNTVFTTTLNAEPTTSTQIQYIVPDDATGDVVVTAELTDASDNSLLASDDITVTVEPAVAAEIYEAFLLAAPTGDENSDTFYSTATGTLYSFSDVVGTTANLSETIDFGYAYGQSEGATINAPSAYPSYIGYDMTDWGTLNETAFRTSTLSVADFEAITEEQGNVIAEEFEVGSNENTRILDLNADDIIAFQTADERYGLIRVVEVVGTTGSADGLRVEVKVTTE